MIWTRIKSDDIRKSKITIHPNKSSQWFSTSVGFSDRNFRWLMGNTHLRTKDKTHLYCRRSKVQSIFCMIRKSTHMSFHKTRKFHRYWHFCKARVAIGIGRLHWRKIRPYIFDIWSHSGIFNTWESVQYIFLPRSVVSPDILGINPLLRQFNSRLGFSSIIFSW